MHPSLAVTFFIRGCGRFYFECWIMVQGCSRHKSCWRVNTLQFVMDGVGKRDMSLFWRVVTVDIVQKSSKEHYRILWMISCFVLPNMHLIYADIWSPKNSLNILNVYVPFWLFLLAHRCSSICTDSGWACRILWVSRWRPHENIQVWDVKQQRNISGTQQFSWESYQKGPQWELKSLKNP